VVELVSDSDAGPIGLQALRRKMEIYQRQGAQLGWLLVPQVRQGEIWRAGQSGCDLLAHPARLDGTALCPRLAVNLDPIWTL
jgi:Uma2 family endonuclease